MTKSNKTATERRPTNTTYQPTTGARCGCRPGVARDNCPACEGTGWIIDFRAIHARRDAKS